MTWEANAVAHCLTNMVIGGESYISYLPLSHIAAQMTDIFIAINYASTVYFADKDALVRFKNIQIIFKKLKSNTNSHKF